MSDPNTLSAAEGALKKGADYVDTARTEVEAKCKTMSDRVAEMMSGWGGQGASSFGNLMVAWQDKQRLILKALEDLSRAMVDTQADNVATDENQSSAHSNLQSRLG